MHKNNNGFSLVELIVVVLIMAIVAVALAPQVIKWIENSRIASDIQMQGSLEDACALALTDQDAFGKVSQGGYEIIMRKGSSGVVTYEYRERDSAGNVVSYTNTKPNPNADYFWKSFLKVQGLSTFAEFEEKNRIRSTRTTQDIVLDLHVYEGGFTFSEFNGISIRDIKIS